MPPIPYPPELCSVPLWPPQVVFLPCHGDFESAKPLPLFCQPAPVPPLPQPPLLLFLAGLFPQLPPPPQPCELAFGGPPCPELLFPWPPLPPLGLSSLLLTHPGQLHDS